MNKKDILKRIKHSLWVRGYHVREVSDLNLGYDFIVNEKIRVKLIQAGEERKEDGFDILVAWEKEIIHKPLWIAKNGIRTKRPEEVFGKVEITNHKK